MDLHTVLVSPPKLVHYEYVGIAFYIFGYEISLKQKQNCKTEKTERRKHKNLNRTMESSEKQQRNYIKLGWKFSFLR